MNKIKLLFLFLPAIIFISCSSDNTTEPENTSKTVKYYSFISPSDPSVVKTVSYTNPNGQVEHESVAIFQRTLTFAKGSVLTLSASGSISSIQNVSVTVEIYIDDVLVASENNNGSGYASASITATVP